jgi:hypothetical protein
VRGRETTRRTSTDARSAVRCDGQRQRQSAARTCTYSSGCARGEHTHRQTETKRCTNVHLLQWMRQRGPQPGRCPWRWSGRPRQSGCLGCSRTIRGVRVRRWAR